MADTPKIRFKGFTDAWEQRKLGNYCDMFNGDRSSKYPNADDMVSDGIPFINAGDLEKGTVNLMTCNRISREKYNDLGGAKLQRGDIVYCLRGTLGKNAFIDNFDEGTVASSLVALRPKNIDGRYLYFILNSDIEYRQRIVRDEGAAQPNLSAKSVSEYIIPVPSATEQQQVSAYFSKLDALITLHQRRCDETIELKKYMLQKMFPQNGKKIPEIRFAGFTDDWEQRKLEEFGKATGGTSIESEFSEDGIYKVISIGSYSEDSIYRDQGIRAVESEKTLNRILNKGDITMILNDKTASGNIIGRVLLIEESGVYVYNQRTERIELDNENYDSQFIYTMLNAPEIRDKIIKQSQGNTQIYVNWPTISQTEYLVPQIKEQQRIGSYFRYLDHLITLHQRKCDGLKEVKKFMLQNMFPQKG